MLGDGSVTAGIDALQEGRWLDARTAFEAALEENETAEVLMGLGQALWWLGETRRSVEFHQRAYVAFRRAGDAEQAAWAAMWLGLTYGSDFGNTAAFNGWIERAERVLQGTGPSPMLGRLWLVRTFGSTDLTRSRERTEQVLNMARDFGDYDLELCALAHLGQVLVELAQIEEGLSLIDEAMAGTFGGERNRFDTVVFTSCGMLAACELAADIERATQWCQIADDFIRKYGCPFLHAQCRAGYGGILVLTGHWAEAERELVAAIRVSKGAYPPIYSAALARLADLRLSQGRLEEAEQLLAGVDNELDCAIPVAKAQLARGEPSVATAVLQRRLHSLGERCGEIASTLDLLIEAHLDCGNLDAAAAAAERLKELALQHNRDLITARAASAYARLLIAQEERHAAIEQLEKALNRFSRLHLPLETARVRLDLARVLVNEHPEVAIAEARSALVTFDRLGAGADADAASALLRSMGAAGRIGQKNGGVLTQREQEVLRLIGLGFSNPEIAQRLLISRKTASHHVSNVLAKLGLRNRAQAVAYATRLWGETNPR
jgi:DNA-binding CsgD family transcriptional regulator